MLLEMGESGEIVADSEILQSSEDSPSTRPRLWLKALGAIGIVILLGGGAASWFGWRQLQAHLPDLVSDELSRALGRPIKLGPLQRLSFNGLQFGETIIPPTAEDFTWARVQMTAISLNPWDLVFRRTFRPSLLMIRPEIAIKQRFDRQWVFKRPGSLDKEGLIRTEIGRIRIRNAEVSVGPVTRQEIAEVPEGISSTQLFILQNVTLHVQFSGKENELVNLSLGGRLKNGTFQARGASNLQTRETNLTLQGKKLRIDVLNPFLGGNLYLGEGYVYNNLYLEYRPEQPQPVSVEGAIRLQNGEAIIAGLPSRFQKLYGRLQFRGQRVVFDDATFAFGPLEGRVQGSVSLQDGYQMGVFVPDFTVEQVAEAFDQALPLAAEGRFGLETRLLGPIQEPRVQGVLDNLEAIAIDRLTFDTVQANFSGGTQKLVLDNLTLRPSEGGSITAQGQVDFQEDLLAARGLPPTALTFTAQADLPLDPLAAVYRANLPVKLGRLTAIAEGGGPLQAVTGTANWQLQEGIAVGSGRVDYADRRVTLADTELVIADTGTITATGQADLTTQELALNADVRVPLDELAATAAIALPAGLVLGTLTANTELTGPFLNPTADALWQLAGGTVPGQGRLNYADQRLALQDTTLDVGGGTLEASGQADLRTSLWSVGLAGTGLGLSTLSPQLLGTADLAMRASGSLRDLSPASIQADGDLRFPQGVPFSLVGANILVDGPIDLAFTWDGSILGIPSLTGPGVTTSGQITTVLNPATGFPQPDFLDFTTQLKDYDLARVDPLLPLGNFGFPVRGRLDFDGTFRGRLPTPVFQGDLALRGIAAGPLALRSDVSGSILGGPEIGVQVDLMGPETVIRAAVDRDRLPNSLLFRNGPLLVEVQRSGDWLLGRVDEFPLESLGIHPLKDPDLGVVGGLFRSNFEVQRSTLLTNPTARATFGITRPSVGAIAAQALQGTLRLANWQGRLDNAFLTLGNRTRFDLSGQANLRSPFSASAQVTTDQADIQDILTTLQLYDLADFKTFFAARPLGTAADLDTTPILTQTNDLLEQIARAVAARAQQEATAQAQANALLPPLSTLRGAFAADITLAAAQNADAEMTFNVNGQDWVWGRYAFENRFLAQGTLQNQVLTLDPIRFESGETFMNLEGTLALDGLNTQLQVANLDLLPLIRWLALPPVVAGKVNLLAALTGTPGNPTLLGRFSVDEAAVNGYPLLIGSDFSYRDAWWRFDAQVKGEPEEPLVVRGQVPYALPFMAVQPDSDQLLVQATLGSGGFALLDMFQPYVAWGGGDASLLMEAKGAIANPTVNGAITFQDASITSEFLGESLTELNGTVGFVGDRIQVPGLQGTLLGGNFQLMGDLPFITATAEADPPEQPLTLKLNTLQFNFGDEILSNIDGEVVVTNALQAPTVGGAIDLSGIQVEIGSDVIALAQDLFVDPGVEQVVEDFGARLPKVPPIPGKFDNFTVRLLDPAKIRINPLLSLDAIGEVAVSGPFVRPVADGYVELLEGWVNTVTTNFFLVTANRRNQVTFDSRNGFDPYFDLQFEGFLPLQRQYNLETNPYGLGNSSEIPEYDPLRSLTLFDEILIDAEVKGYFSDGWNVLQLSSFPDYPEDRLLSMVTGGHLSDLPGGEPAIATLANLGFAFFTEQQQSIGDSLGLRRLRLGVTTQVPTSENTDLFGVGVGVTAGITDDLSATLVQVLNQDQPYQFNVQYRLTNDMAIGTSTNFSNDTRIFWQYRLRF